VKKEGVLAIKKGEKCVDDRKQKARGLVYIGYEKEINFYSSNISGSDVGDCTRGGGAGQP
jgi:hypothetical protein